jgi:CspA family cold shock protein
MPTGRVKSFNPDRGFGFILPDDGGPDVFVHIHDVEAAGMKTLVAGQLVAYEIGPARGACPSRKIKCGHTDDAIHRGQAVAGYVQLRAQGAG